MKFAKYYGIFIGAVCVTITSCAGNTSFKSKHSVSRSSTSSFTIQAYVDNFLVERKNLAKLIEKNIRFITCSDAPIISDENDTCIEVYIFNKTGAPLCLSVGEFPEPAYSRGAVLDSDNLHNISLVENETGEHVKRRNTHIEYWQTQPQRSVSGPGSYHLIPNGKKLELYYSLDTWWRLKADREYRVKMFGNAFLCGTIGANPTEFVAIDMMVSESK